MSAYLVSEQHIHYLMEAVHAWGLHAPHGNSVIRREKNLDHEARTNLGMELWEENQRSLNAKYPPELMPNYMASNRHWGTLDPVQVIKACHCYEYQSCEHDDWRDSRAYAIIQGILDAAMSHLRGYDDAEWGPPKDGPALISLLDMARGEA